MPVGGILGKRAITAVRGALGRFANKRVARDTAREVSQFQRRRATRTSIRKTTGVAAEAADLAAATAGTKKPPGFLGTPTRRIGAALGAAFTGSAILSETTGVGLLDRAGITAGVTVDPRVAAAQQQRLIEEDDEASLQIAQLQEREQLFGSQTLQDPFTRAFGTFEERATRNAILADKLIPNLILSGIDVSAILASTGPSQSQALAGLSTAEQARLAQASRSTGPISAPTAKPAIDPQVAGALALAGI